MSRKLGFRLPLTKNLSYATDSHHKLSWNFNIQCDHEIEHRKPDLFIVDKEKKTVCIIDIAVPGDNRVGTKELEKILKYQDLKMEISRIWTLNQVEVITTVAGALGTISKRLEGFLEKIGIAIPVEMLQETVLLETPRINRRVMDTKDIQL